MTRPLEKTNMTIARNQTKYSPMEIFQKVKKRRNN